MGLDISLRAFKVNPNTDDDVKPYEDLGDIRSSAHPDNMCTIGYYRSSYNSGGFNSVAKNLIGVYGFHHLFCRDLYDESDYYFQPDWDEVKKRTIDTKAKFSSAVAENGGMLKVMFEGPNPYISKQEYQDLVPDESAALKIFMSEKSRDRFSDDGYSNRNGAFFFNSPLEVLGFVPGYQFGSSGVHIIHRIKAEYATYYEQMMDILVEACDIINTRDDKANIWVGWSG